MVHAYRYRGSLPAVGLGSRVRFAGGGSTIVKLTSMGARAHSVSFLGRVLRSTSAGLTMRLGDRQSVTVSAHRVSGITSVAHAGRTPLAVAALTFGSFPPGVVVLVEETLGRGATSVSVTPGRSSSTGATGERQANGVVSSGSMTFTVDDPGITDGYVVGDQVDVTYSQDSSGALDASDVEYNESDALGTVDAVSSSSLTITDSNSGAQETFTADPDEGMFDGINDGDSVDVSYHMSSGNQVVDGVDETGS